MELKDMFVPFELAKKLKEKGFDEPCLSAYVKYSDGYKLDILSDYWHIANELKGKKYINNSLFNFIKERNISGDCFPLQNAIASPLYQQVIDWFREKYNLELSSNKMWRYSGEKKDTFYQGVISNFTLERKNTEYILYISNTLCNTSYEAFDLIIEEALKLI